MFDLGEEAVRLLGLFLAVQFIGQCIAGGPPEIGEVFHLVQLFGEGEGKQMIAQVGVSAYGHGQTLEQRGLAGPAHTNQQVVLGAALARCARQFIAQEGELVLACDEVGEQGVVAQPVGVVVMVGGAHSVSRRSHQRRKGSRRKR